jgi:hypothetical protein
MRIILKNILIIMVILGWSLLAVSCASSPTAKDGGYIDDHGNAISEQEAINQEEQARLKAEEEAFYDECDEEDSGRHWFIVDVAMGFWSGVTATGHFIKGVMPEWW